MMSYLTAPVRQISVQPGRAIIQLGDVANGAQVQLVKEHQHWVVDDIEIVSSADAAATVQLKQALRSQVVFNNTRSLSPRNVVADERPSVVRRPGDTRPSVGGRFDLRRTEQADPEVRNLGIAAATTPASPVLQDPEIDHAALFGSQHAAAEVVHADASSFAEPARVRPEADAMQLPSADELPVDMDELFGDLDRDPESMITQAEPQPVRSSVPAPQQVVSAVPINDTGRVVDPALQPIRIPR